MPLDPVESSLPQWMRETLQEPVVSSSQAYDRIMQTVLAESRQQRRRRLPTMARRFDWRRRGVLSPLVGVMTTMALALTVMLRLDHFAPSSLDAFTQIVGDSVVPIADTTEQQHLGHGVNHNGRWLDTLRIVEFVLRGPSIHSASALGDFNRWQRSATPLAKVALAEWRARVLVPRDALPYAPRMAVLVNARQMVPADPR